MIANPYELRRCVDEYLLFHYGTASDLCPFGFIPREVLRFHRRVLEECLLPVRFPVPTRGLDLGCAVGRFTFELGRVVDQVLGIDRSKPFIHMARRMAQTHALTVRVKETGTQFRPITLNVPNALQRSHVEFRVGDALNLSALPDGSFHVVAALNLICRLPRPREFLCQLHRLVAPHGQLVLASPFTWFEEYTPRQEWPAPPEAQRLLGPHFRLARRRNLPFLIREHRRKFQLVVSEVSVFRRRVD